MTVTVQKVCGVFRKAGLPTVLVRRAGSKGALVVAREGYRVTKVADTIRVEYLNLFRVSEKIAKEKLTTAFEVLKEAGLNPVFGPYGDIEIG